MRYTPKRIYWSLWQICTVRNLIMYKLDNMRSRNWSKAMNAKSVLQRTPFAKRIPAATLILGHCVWCCVSVHCCFMYFNTIILCIGVFCTWYVANCNVNYLRCKKTPQMFSSIQVKGWVVNKDNSRLVYSTYGYVRSVRYKTKSCIRYRQSGNSGHQDAVAINCQSVVYQ